jgi:hypothetical protein
MEHILSLCDAKWCLGAVEKNTIIFIRKTICIPNQMHTLLGSARIKQSYTTARIGVQGVKVAAVLARMFKHF